MDGYLDDEDHEDLLEDDEDASDRYCRHIRCTHCHFFFTTLICCVVGKRRVWTNEEDDAIKQMVAKYGTKSWALIAENLSKEHSIAGRSGKQCRERWHNHLGIVIFKFGMFGYV
jgi:hypothetical protein